MDLCLFHRPRDRRLDQDLLVLKDFFFLILTSPRMNGTADTREIMQTKWCLSTNHQFQLRKCSQHDYKQVPLNSNHPHLSFHPCGTLYLSLLPRGYTSSTPLWSVSSNQPFLLLKHPHLFISGKRSKIVICLQLIL